MTFWSGNAFVLDERSSSAGDFTSFADVFVSAPNTLLRTLIWVYVESWADYEVGSSGLLNLPVSWAFADLNSQHHSPGELGENPSNAGEEVIATDVVPLSFTGLGWPPTASSHLSGSVNDLSSDATIDSTYNINAFMHGSGRSYVDSHAQRHFTELPDYGFSLHNWATSVAGGLPQAYTAWVMVRLLYEHP